MTERFGFKTLINEDEVFGLCVFPVGSNNFDEFSNEQTALTPKQTHSLNVGIVEYPWETFEDTDALVTFREDCPIGVCTADCVPILLYAPDIKGAAAVHAGWRGSLGGIVDNTLDILEKRGADLGKLTVAFGPSISAAKYEVDQNLADKFIEAGVISFYIGHILVNIPGRYILIFNDYPLISIINHSELNRDVCSAGDIKESGVPSVGHATRSLRSDRQIDIVPRLEHFYDRIRQ